MKNLTIFDISTHLSKETNCTSLGGAFVEAAKKEDSREVQLLAQEDFKYSVKTTHRYL